MIEDLLVINEAGQAIYSWHEKGNDEDFNDDLISGFLTALNSFATIERGEDIKSLKLKETLILFEKKEDLFQKLVFVVTTKNETIIELLHAFIHEVMDQFILNFKQELDQEFNGNVLKFRLFDVIITQILIDYGLDILRDSQLEIDKKKTLKAILFIESKGGNIFYTHAKEYINKEKMSFLIPLLVNSSKLLYKNYLNQEIKWILLNTIENKFLLIENRNKIIITKIYENEIIFKSQKILEFPYFKTKDKYLKKPQKIVEKFEIIKFNHNIKQLFLVDLVGKIFFKKIIDKTYDCSEYIPETISFLTASKKSSEELFNRIMLISIINGEELTTICMNFNNFALVLIGNSKDFYDYKQIQELCVNIYQQL